MVRALDHGERFVATRNGVPVGELRPAQRQFMGRQLLLAAFRTTPPIDAERFRADLDRVVDQDVEPQP